MSLSTKIAAALDENTRALNLPATITVEEARARLTLQLSALDAVGLAIDRLEMAVSPRLNLATEELKRRGQALTARITYLMEPLRVLETEPEGDLQIRSEVPTHRGRKRGYYEIRLTRDGGMRIERFVFDEDAQKRTPAPCQLTREVLERLVDDCVAVLV